MLIWKDIKVILQEKRGKRIALLSLCVFLLIAVIVFLSTYKLFEDNYLKQLNDYLGGMLRIIDSGRNELQMRSRITEDDILTRAELGMKLYEEDSGLTDQEKLEHVRSAVSASSISLLNEQKQILSTTGSECPEDVFQACIQTLGAGESHLEFYPALSENGAETGKSDARGFVMLPVPGDTNQSLVFEFPCKSFLEMYNSFADWSGMFEDMLNNIGATAYTRTGDVLASYPVNYLADDKNAKLHQQLTKIFQNPDSFRRTDNGGLVKRITLLGKFHFAALTYDAQEETDILLTIPLTRLIGNIIYISLAISAIIGIGMILTQIYAFRRLLLEDTGKDTAAASFNDVCRVTWPGIVVAFVVTLLFSYMLLMLETRSNAAFFAVTYRASLQDEIDWRKNEEETLRSTFLDFYRARTQTLAAFLMEHPDDLTRAGLEELNRIAGSEYLMRFDRTGQELVSSNTYTGFSVEKNLSEEYQAVLMGYPSAVAGPEDDPYTGKSQIGAAILMTDSQGEPDGFLLAVYSSADLSAELNRMKLENTVNHFSVQKGHIAAVINDADGRFIAHTNYKMIGQKAENYLPEIKPGSGFEGFTTYGEDTVYVSAGAEDGKTFLFIIPEFKDTYALTVALLMVLLVLLVLIPLYYPTAGVLSALAKEYANGKLPYSSKRNPPMMVYCRGYILFLTVFVGFALICSSAGLWTTFDYVFSGAWSKGVHLFSIWTTLFVVVITLFCLYLMRNVLSLMENRLSLRSKTITRLASSLITYIAIIFLLFWLLDMFGVNTTAMLASAGIISIAVGMGAQSMASDLLAGFFMMLEGSVHVGDYVTIGNVTGHVTDMGIRTTEITDNEGNVVILSNSKVTGLNNKSTNHIQRNTEKKPDAKS